MAKLWPFLALAALMAGCSSPDTSADGQGYDGGAVAPPVYQPTAHDWASNSPEAVAAGDVFAHPFDVQGSSIAVAYTVAMRDSSAVDVGFILASDLAEYRQGEHVDGWAAQSNTAGTSQQATLGPGSYDFVIHCRNSFADCDLTYSLTATY